MNYTRESEAVKAINEQIKAICSNLNTTEDTVAMRVSFKKENKLPLFQAAARKLHNWILRKPGVRKGHSGVFCLTVMLGAGALAAASNLPFPDALTTFVNWKSAHPVVDFFGLQNAYRYFIDTGVHGILYGLPIAIASIVQMHRHGGKNPAHDISKKRIEELNQIAGEDREVGLALRRFKENKEHLSPEVFESFKENLKNLKGLKTKREELAVEESSVLIRPSSPK